MPKASLLQAPPQVRFSVLTTDLLVPIRAQLFLDFIWQQHELAALLRFCAIKNDHGQHSHVI